MPGKQNDKYNYSNLDKCLCVYVCYQLECIKFCDCVLQTNLLHVWHVCSQVQISFPNKFIY